MAEGKSIHRKQPSNNAKGLHSILCSLPALVLLSPTATILTPRKCTSYSGNVLPAFLLLRSEQWHFLREAFPCRTLTQGCSVMVIPCHVTLLQCCVHSAMLSESICASVLLCLQESLRAIVFVCLAASIPFGS